MNLKKKSINLFKRIPALVLCLNMVLTSFLAIVPNGTTTILAADNSCSSQTTTQSGITKSSTTSARVGGVALDQAAKFLAQMDDIKGAYYDATLDRVVFIGKTNTVLPEFDKDDLAVAIRTLIFNKTIPRISLDFNNPDNNKMKVTTYGNIEDTRFGKVLFDADVKLKDYTQGYNASDTKITSSVSSYKSLMERYLDKTPNPVSGGFSRVWIQPNQIILKKDDTANSFIFDTVTMKIVYESLSTENDVKYDQAGTELAQDFTQNYDQYSEEISAWKDTKQLGKIVGVIKWLSDNGIATDFNWARDYSPKYVPTAREIDKRVVTHNYTTGGNNYTYTLTGGVTYATANGYNSDNGISASLKSSSEAVNAPKEDIHWTFNNGGQTYESVAVAADAFRSLGSYNTSATDMAFPTSGDLNLAFQRSYSSFSGGQQGIGRGWSFLPAKLFDNNPVASGVLRASCSGDTFTRRYKVAFSSGSGFESFTYWCPGSLYKPDDNAYHSQITNTLVDSTSTKFTVTQTNNTQYEFTEKTTDDTFKLTKILDKNGNPISYNYDSQNRLSSISDENNHTITLNYNSNNLVSSITDWSNRTVSYTYDTQGNLLTVTDPRGNATAYTYDTENKLTSITDREGKVTTVNTYTPEAKIATQKDAANITKTFTYDETNKLISSTDSNTPARTTSLKYDSKGRILENTDALSNKTVYTYGTEYAPLTIKDKRNNTITNTYDSNGNLTSVTYPDNKKVDYEYNSKNKVTKIIDRRYGATPKETTFTYNTAGDLLSVNESGLTTAYTYNGDGESLTKTDPLNKVTTWTRDTFGNKLTEKNHLNQTTNYQYNNRGWLTQETDPESKQLSYTYDNNQNVLTVVNAAGTTINQYDKENRVKKTILPDNSTTDYTYNNSGSKATVVDAANNTTTYGYDTYQNLTSKLDSLNRTMTYEFDKLNRRTGRNTPLGKVAHWEYDANGNITKRIDEGNQQTTYTYDNLNRLTVITYPDTTTVTNTYDDRSNLTSVVSPAGTASYSYDIYNRLTQTTDVNGKVVTYEYDNGGNLTKIIYPGSKTVTYIYDGANRLLSTTDWNNSVTSYEYFNNGLLKKKTLPNGVVTNYTYDTSNRLSETQHKKGTTTLAQFNYTRDSLGNIKTATESGTFVSTSSGTSTLLSQGKSIVASSQKTGYEATKANDGVISGSYWEAVNGFPATITVDLGATYAVDKVVMKVDWGTRTENVEILGSTDNSTFTTIVTAANYSVGTVPVTFNAVNARYVRLKVNSNSAAPAAQIHEFEVWGQTQAPPPPSGTELLTQAWNLTGNNGASEKYQTISSTALQGKSSLRITYDLHGLNALGNDASAIIFDQNGWKYISLSNYGQNGLNGSQTVDIPLSAFTGLDPYASVGTLHTRFWYGSAFNVDITSIKAMDSTPANSQTKNFTYDLLSRVLTATSSFGNNTYTYDKVGNMLTSQLGSTSTTLTYNNDNQLTQKGSTTFSYDNKGNQTARGTTALTYDFDNRLKSFTPSGGSAIEYVYDGAGKRSVKKVGGTATKQYVNDISGELTNVLIEKDVPSNTESLFLYGKGLISQGGSTSSSRQYYLEDGMGNVRAVTDNNGDVTKSYSYDPYGNQFEGDNTAAFRFKGEQYDPNTDLIFMRARYYDPSTGRFISKDPVEGTIINPQSQNGYSFVNNDPINYADPSGKWLETAWDVANIAYDVCTGDKESLAYDSAAALLPFVPAGLTKVGKVANIANDAKRFNKDQEALVDLAKQAKRSGVSNENADTLLDWGKEYGLEKVLDHRNTQHWDPYKTGEGIDHLHIGPVNHIEVK